MRDPTNRVRSPLAEVIPLLDVMLSIWCHASNTWYGWCVVGYPISSLSTPFYTVYAWYVGPYLVSEDLLEVMESHTLDIRPPDIL